VLGSPRQLHSQGLSICYRLPSSDRYQSMWLSQSDHHTEFPALLDVLQALADLRVMGLSLKIPEIFFAARHQFPTLKLHASTLAAVHNSAGVHQLEHLGSSAWFWLASCLYRNQRQLLERRNSNSRSSFTALFVLLLGPVPGQQFRGGHSGLQGRCVQPCACILNRDERRILPVL